MVSCVSLVTGILLLGIWSPNRAEFFAPGGLSHNHAQIWSAGNAEDRCVACHAAGSTSPVAWVLDAFSGGSHIGEPQYSKCLNCHQETLDQEHALLVHNISRDQINQITARSKGADSNHLLNMKIFGTPVNHQGEIACANCHQEHHGKDHDLAAMTDLQCQSCHAQQFESFDQGHPEFQTRLLTSPNRISFDHFSHQSKHFAEANRGFDCNACHTSDTDGNVMQTRSFEAACASCHTDKIEASLTGGMPVFSLPMLDLDAFRQHQLEIGDWPELAAGTFDGELPPAMKVLLSSDPRAVDAMRKLGPEFDLIDVDPADPVQVTAAYHLAISIKSLLLDLSRDGQHEMIARFKSISNNQVDQAQLQKMISSLSPDTFSQAQEKWFPGLPAEQERLRVPEKLNLKDSVKLIKSPNKIQLVAYLESREEDSETLAKNPLKALYSPKPDPAPLRDQPETRKFQNLPDQVSSNDGSTFDFVGGNRRTGFDPDQPYTVKNKFFDQTKTGATEETIDKSKVAQQQAVQPTNTATGESRNDARITQQKTGISESGISQSGSAPGNTSSPNQDPNSILVENPLKTVPGLANSKSPESAKSPESTKPPESTKSSESTKASDSNKTSESNKSPAQATIRRKFETLESALNSSAKSPPKSPANSSPQETSTKDQDKPNHEATIVIRDNDLASDREIPAGELLAENPLRKMMKPAANVAKESDPPKTTDPDLSQKSQVNSGKKEQGDSAAEQNPPADQIVDDQDPKDSQPAENTDRKVAEDPQQSPSKAYALHRLPPGQQVPLGGWYRDDETFTVAYRQAGHADDLTVSWYDFVASIPGSQSNAAHRDFAKLIAKENSPGLCATCHGNHSTGMGTFQIHWKSEFRDPSKRGFTRFSHRPHTLLSGNDQCKTCHQIKPVGDGKATDRAVSSAFTKASATLPSGDSMRSPECRTGFLPMQKSNCTTCHNQQSKIQNCTQCHNYHVGSTAINH